ncbi:hypothetical protein K470DRAFT_280183 [Piedraia hortae CBS 480.64]|uniref:DUF7707 domain-containing protein n=1 Tax=Piedraia hortae CBS 480.64 TaxID=1314780 RepID=A0A6A7C8L0_9PEZI|nr:hypothetical protein K470DRAFT_280183 [Piedraia hortae CBS 480.64]
MNPLLLTFSLAAFAAAQNNSTGAGAAGAAAPTSGAAGGAGAANLPAGFDPNSVPRDLRMAWCRAQMNTCRQVCNGQAYPNNCNSDTLVWQCTCTDGSKPNISDYGQTVPSLVCERARDDCVAAHPNDLAGQTKCQSVKCGKRNATSSDDSSSSSASATGSKTASSTADATESANGASKTSGRASSASSSGASSSAQSTNAAIALSAGQNYGMALIMGGLALAFGFAL